MINTPSSSSSSSSTQNGTISSLERGLFTLANSIPYELGNSSLHLRYMDIEICITRDKFGSYNLSTIDENGQIKNLNPDDNNMFSIRDIKLELFVVKNKPCIRVTHQNPVPSQVYAVYDQDSQKTLEDIARVNLQLTPPPPPVIVDSSTIEKDWAGYVRRLSRLEVDEMTQNFDETAAGTTAITTISYAIMLQLYLLREGEMMTERERERINSLIDKTIELYVESVLFDEIVVKNVSNQQFNASPTLVAGGVQMLKSKQDINKSIQSKLQELETSGNIVVNYGYYPLEASKLGHYEVLLIKCTKTDNDKNVYTILKFNAGDFANTPIEKGFGTAKGAVYTVEQRIIICTKQQFEDLYYLFVLRRTINPKGNQEAFKQTEAKINEEVWSNKKDIISTGMSQTKDNCSSRSVRLLLEYIYSYQNAETKFDKIYSFISDSKAIDELLNDLLAGKSIESTESVRNEYSNSFLSLIEAGKIDLALNELRKGGEVNLSPNANSNRIILLELMRVVIIEKLFSIEDATDILLELFQKRAALKIDFQLKHQGASGKVGYGTFFDVYFNHLEAQSVDLLRRYFANPNTQKLFVEFVSTLSKEELAKYQPLQYAIPASNGEFIKNIIDAAGDNKMTLLTAPDKQGSTPLHTMVRDNMVGLAQAILSTPNINMLELISMPDSNNLSPFIHAIRNNNIELIGNMVRNAGPKRIELFVNHDQEFSKIFMNITPEGMKAIFTNLNEVEKMVLLNTPDKSGVALINHNIVKSNSNLQSMVMKEDRVIHNVVSPTPTSSADVDNSMANLAKFLEEMGIQTHPTGDLAGSLNLLPHSAITPNLSRSNSNNSVNSIQ